VFDVRGIALRLPPFPEEKVGSKYIIEASEAHTAS
jgi:hypothetical protein